MYDNAEFVKDLDLVIAEIRAILIDKNLKYGDSVLNPIRIFSKVDQKEQIKVRLDDKFSRLMRGNGEETEDVNLDIIGYLLILRIAEIREMCYNNVV